MPSDSDDSGSDRGKVVTEEELDITRHDDVAELDDGRYLVSTDGSTPSPPADPTSSEPSRSAPATERGVEDDSTDTGSTEPITEAEVTDWLDDHLQSVDSQYGFHVTAKFDHGVRRHQVVSNDVVTSFEALVVWYAQHVGDGTPVEDVLGILLAESSVSVRYPVTTLTGLLKRYDLDREDSIGDLVDAVSDEQAVSLDR